jgi:stress-induced morphogen
MPVFVCPWQVKSHNDDPNGSHIAVKVVSTMFEGKNRVQRQQMVYKVRALKLVL